MQIGSANPSWIRRQGVMLLLFVALIVNSLLVLQQQQTIESQKILIRQLFQDSLQLTQLRMDTATHAKK